MWCSHSYRTMMMNLITFCVYFSSFCSFIANDDDSVMALKWRKCKKEIGHGKTEWMAKENWCCRLIPFYTAFAISSLPWRSSDVNSFHSEFSSLKRRAIEEFVHGKVHSSLLHFVRLSVLRSFWTHFQIKIRNKQFAFPIADAMTFSIVVRFRYTFSIADDFFFSVRDENYEISCTWMHSHENQDNSTKMTSGKFDFSQVFTVSRSDGVETYAWMVCIKKTTFCCLLFFYSRLFVRFIMSKWSVALFVSYCE